jgi:alpha-amylase
MGDTRGDGRDIILQAFHWNLVKSAGDGTIDGRDKSWYALLTEKAASIAETGFTAVYLPPPWRDDSQWESNGKHGGGEGYFWHDFDLDSRYGTAGELKKLIETLHGHKIRVLIDLVTNHRDAARMKGDIWPWPGPHWAIQGSDTGGSFFDGKFDLNLAHPEVHGRIRQAMNDLLDNYGVDGWRWDYVWGFDVKQVTEWIRGTTAMEYLSIGEYWQDSPSMTNDPMIQRYGPDEGDRIIGWARESGGCAFDMILKRAIVSADPRRLKEGLNLRPDPEVRRSIITFVDNHDTGASPFSPASGWGQQCWPCSPSFKSKAYAFVLTASGTPCVYWPDCYDWGLGGEIRELIKLRKAAGITASSGWTDLTDRFRGFAGIFHNGEGQEALALSLGSDWTGPGIKGWKRALEKPGEYTFWLRSGKGSS